MVLLEGTITMNVMQPMSLGPSRRQNQLFSPTEDTSFSFATVFTSIVVFIIFSRFSELVSTLFRTGIPLVLIFGGLALVAVIIDGRLLLGFDSVQGKTLIAFTVWMILAGIFGVWRGGSYGVITSIWLKSLTIFFMVVGSTRNKKDLRWVMVALAAAAAFVVFQSYVFGTGDAERGAVSFQGSTTMTFSNANGLALSLVVGLPFVLFFAMNAQTMLIRIACYGILAIGSFALLKTGSRGGLLALGVILLLIFLRVSVIQKFLMVLFVTLSLTAGISILPRSATERFRSILGVVQSEEAFSADESRKTRAKLFFESVLMTAQHPLLGVGPGNFLFEAAKDAEESGRRSNWVESHNCYTKVSSETGVPGLLMFGTVMFLSIWRIRGLYRSATKQGNLYWANLSFCTYLSFCAYALFSTFDNGAYLYGLPLLSGLVVSILAVAKRDMSRQSPNARSIPNPLINRFANPAVGSGSRQKVVSPVSKWNGRATAVPQLPRN